MSVVYTSITNAYDLPVPVAEPGVSFVCFTERRMKNGKGWEYRTLACPPTLASGHYINRFHKIFPHQILDSTRYSVYVDGNIRYQASFDKLIAEFAASGAALGVFRHPDGRTLREEADACRTLGKFDTFDEVRLSAQLGSYEEDRFDIDSKISANYLIVRDHAHQSLSGTMSLWWSHLFEYTKRDQMSLNYVLWKTNLPWIYLDELEGIDHANLVRNHHHRPVARRLMDRVRRAVVTR